MVRPAQGWVGLLQCCQTAWEQAQTGCRAPRTFNMQLCISAAGHTIRIEKIRYKYAGFPGVRRSCTYQKYRMQKILHRRNKPTHAQPQPAFAVFWRTPDGLGGMVCFASGAYKYRCSCRTPLVAVLSRTTLGLEGMMLSASETYRYRVSSRSLWPGSRLVA